MSLRTFEADFTPLPLALNLVPWQQYWEIKLWNLRTGECAALSRIQRRLRLALKVHLPVGVGIQTIKLGSGCWGSGTLSLAHLYKRLVRQFSALMVQYMRGGWINHQKIWRVSHGA